MQRAYLIKLLAIGFIAYVTMNAFGPMMPAYGTGNEVPFAEKISSAITKYYRLRPNIATAGPLREGAIAELKSFGFATILDLRSADEGIDIENRAVEAAGLRYLNIPVTDVIPSDEQVVAFARVVEDATNFPLLVHCGSANRVGAMWTLYLVRRGLPISFAVDEGRAIGLQGDREKAVLKYLDRQ